RRLSRYRGVVDIGTNGVGDGQIIEYTGAGVNDELVGIGPPGDPQSWRKAPVAGTIAEFPQLITRQSNPRPHCRAHDHTLSVNVDVVGARAERVVHRGRQSSGQHSISRPSVVRLRVDGCKA